MSNKIGDLSIIKKHFGDLEIIKEVLNGSTIYESVKTYTITSTITNGSYTGDTEITNTASVTISANTGYSLPSTISVTGATYTYNSTTGVVSLSSPTGNVTISATCVASYPVKGDVILLNMDGTGDKRYRVLKKVSGTTYLVVSLFSVGNDSALDSNNTSTYFGKTLDTYLNTTWYGSLTSTAKSAIVSKYITIYQYSQLSSLPSNRSSWANTTASQTVASNTRYVYALGNADIEEYFNGVYTGNDLSNAFNLSTLQNVWLRDRKDSYYAWSMSNSINYGIIANDRGYVSKRVNASFQINLSKISFTIEA